MSSCAFQKAQPQTPNVRSISTVIPTMAVGVESLRAHVGTGAHERIARSQGACEHRAHSKVGNFHFLLVIDEKVGRLNVPMHDLVLMKVIQTLENLSRDFSKAALGHDLLGFQHICKGATVHILQYERDLAAPIRSPVATHHVRRASSSKDVHFRDDLLPHGQLVLLLNDLEGINFAGSFVLHLVHLAAAAVT